MVERRNEQPLGENDREYFHAVLFTTVTSQVCE